MTEWWVSWKLLFLQPTRRNISLLLIVNDEQMKHVIISCLVLLSFLSCNKDHGSRVDIYVLKSYTVNVNQSTNPFTLSISNAILQEIPLVADKDISFYHKASATFKLKKDIKSIIKNYGSDHAFAVTVDGEPIYYGKFHPAFLSSMVFGLPTIDPILFRNNELEIKYVTIDGIPDLLQYDKRNDSRIIKTLEATNRLR